MGGIVMERKIGEEFEYNGVRLKVVEHKYGGCANCYFCYDCTGGLRYKVPECSKNMRHDNTTVLFKKM